MGSIGGRMRVILGKKAVFKVPPLVFQGFLVKTIEKQGTDFKYGSATSSDAPLSARMGGRREG